MPFAPDSTKKGRILGSLMCDADVDLNKYDDVLALYKDDFERDRLESQLCILHRNHPREIEEETGGTEEPCEIFFRL